MEQLSKAELKRLTPYTRALYNELTELVAAAGPNWSLQFTLDYEAAVDVGDDVQAPYIRFELRGPAVPPWLLTGGFGPYPERAELYFGSSLTSMEPPDDFCLGYVTGQFTEQDQYVQSVLDRVAQWMHGELKLVVTTHDTRPISWTIVGPDGPIAERVSWNPLAVWHRWFGTVTSCRRFP
jgi:hypothetical protein